jgi:hypothetical protein
MTTRDATLQESNKPVTTYWIEHYVGEQGICTLCGNTGLVDTRGTFSPAGVQVGRVNFCIWPNGQARRQFEER